MNAPKRGQRVNKQKLCELLGWNREAFDRHVRDGMPVAERPTSRGGDYVLYTGDVIRWLTEREVERALEAAGMVKAEVINFEYEKARLTREQADKTEIENKLARKELLPAVEFAKTCETLFTAIRDRVMAVRSTAPLLVDAAVSEGLPKVRALLDEALTEALDDCGSIELEEAQAA